jgi:hypothetical protein
VERTTKEDATTCAGRCCELPGNTKRAEHRGNEPCLYNSWLLKPSKTNTSSC